MSSKSRKRFLNGYTLVWIASAIFILMMLPWSMLLGRSLLLVTIVNSGTVDCENVELRCGNSRAGGGELVVGAKKTLFFLAPLSNYLCVSIERVGKGSMSYDMGYSFGDESLWITITIMDDDVWIE